MAKRVIDKGSTDKQSLPKKIPTKLSKRKAAAFALIIFLTSFCVMFLISEFVVRFILKKPPLALAEKSGNVETTVWWGVDPVPNNTYDSYGYTFKTDSHGFYSPEIPVQKRGLRIAYLGDSFTEGPGIAQNENFPPLVNSYLQKTFGPTVDYLVAGVGGSAPLHQKFIYHRKVLPFKPDVVVYVLYDNDLGDDLEFRYSQYYARIKVFDSFPSFLRKPALLGQSRLIQTIQLILMDRLTKTYAKEFEQKRSLVSKNPVTVWNSLTAPALDDILNTAKAERSKMVLLYIPNGWEYEHEYQAEPIKEKHYSMMHLTAPEWARQRNVPFFDMAQDFDRIKNMNKEKLSVIYLPPERGYHLNEYGASLVAKRVLDLIKTAMTRTN